MEIRPEILDKHLADAAIEQLADDYSRRGFEIERDVPMGDARADMVARKGESLLVFEVKPGAWTEQKREEVVRLRNQAVHEGGRFILVMLPHPRKKSVEIEGIKDILLRVVDERYQSELSDLAGEVQVTDVVDIDLSSLVADPDGLEVEGSAYVDLEFRSSSESLPLDFHLRLSHDLEPREVVHLNLDLKELHSNGS